MIFGNTDLSDYELLDSGAGEKLERFADFKIIRPDPRAIWQKSYPSKWVKVDAIYRGDKWEKSLPVSEWICCNMVLKLTEFRHVGLFPEQKNNWDWIASQNIKNLKILNLFAYTGGATIAAAKKGAHVTHVDSSKPSLMWASENAKLNKIPTDKIRWIQDDVIKFLKREIRRGVRYDGIIMDPPRFGRGVGGEIWKLENDLPNLVDLCRQVLTDNPIFWLINAYTADLSSIALGQVLSDATKSLDGQLEYDELVLKQQDQVRFLPSGIITRWKKTF